MSKHEHPLLETKASASSVSPPLPLYGPPAGTQKFAHIQFSRSHSLIANNRFSHHLLAPLFFEIVCTLDFSRDVAGDADYLESNSLAQTI